jgi:hypothetical protein
MGGIQESHRRIELGRHPHSGRRRHSFYLFSWICRRYLNQDNKADSITINSISLDSTEHGVSAVTLAAGQTFTVTNAARLPLAARINTESPSLHRCCDRRRLCLYRNGQKLWELRLLGLSVIFFYLSLFFLIILILFVFSVLFFLALIFGIFLSCLFVSDPKRNLS